MVHRGSLVNRYEIKPPERRYGTIQPREREREKQTEGRARWREGAEDKKAKKKKGGKRKISKEEESVGRGHYRASLVRVRCIEVELSNKPTDEGMTGGG